LRTDTVRQGSAMLDSENKYRKTIVINDFYSLLYLIIFFNTFAFRFLFRIISIFIKQTEEHFRV